MVEEPLQAESVQWLAALRPRRLVVGITCERFVKSISGLLSAVYRGIAAGGGWDEAVIVVAAPQGHEALGRVVAQTIPAEVPTLVTGYNGMVGKGSAVRALFHSVMLLDAEALLILGGDSLSLDGDSLPMVLAPIRGGQADLVLPVPAAERPLPLSAALITGPLIEAIFQARLVAPTPGDMALSGELVRRLARRDVWETDVARDGLDMWVTVEALAQGMRVAEVSVAPKRRRNRDSLLAQEARFVQEVGTLFRLLYLQRRLWQPQAPRHPRPTILPLASQLAAVGGEIGGDEAGMLWEAAQAASRRGSREQWELLLGAAQGQALASRLDAPAPEPSAWTALQWATLVYELAVIYNKGEGDPDKVAAALFPLMLARAAALMTTITDDAGWDAACQATRAAFGAAFPWFVRRWEHYSPPAPPE